MDKIHITAIMIYVLLKVKTCLYLSPSIRARSLSKPNAVSVNIDTVVTRKPERVFAKAV